MANTISKAKEYSLEPNHLVELRNGKIGAVGSFNGNVSWIIFKAYMTVKGKYDAKLRHKNESYDIIRVYDGSSITNVDNVFKNSFNIDDYPLLWEGNGGRERKLQKTKNGKYPKNTEEIDITKLEEEYNIVTNTKRDNTQIKPKAVVKKKNF